MWKTSKGSRLHSTATTIWSGNSSIFSLVMLPCPEPQYILLSPPFIIINAHTWRHVFKYQPTHLDWLFAQQILFYWKLSVPGSYKLCSSLISLTSAPYFIYLLVLSLSWTIFKTLWIYGPLREARFQLSGWKHYWSCNCQMSRAYQANVLLITMSHIVSHLRGYQNGNVLSVLFNDNYGTNHCVKVTHRLY